MAIFDRIRRTKISIGGRAKADPVASFEPVAEHLLPEINQRVTIAVDGAAPVSSRVEDVRSSVVQLAFPALELEFGDAVTITWERDGVWFSLVTNVTGTDSRSAVPTIVVSTAGRLSRYDEQRLGVHRAIELPIELSIVRSRTVRTGRELHTSTTTVGPDAFSFTTSAQFAIGDLIEATVRVGASADDQIRARVRIVRTDVAPGDVRYSCTAVFDEILRTDRARLMAIVAAGSAVEAEELAPSQQQSAEPTTVDGVGGRDEPRSLSDLQGVLDWLARDRDARSKRD